MANPFWLLSNRIMFETLSLNLFHYIKKSFCYITIIVVLIQTYMLVQTYIPCKVTPIAHR
ncbi:hypothetical protein HanIR_Chr12g0579441 [Helianthus annuus]|nr:hypothetical protein HanIR_Chr12g0579441 [Helianthus annuus]